MGRNKWTSGGHWDEIIHDGRPTETVSVHVRANSTTKMWLTNNGRWIRNNDGSEGWFEYTNTTRFGITAGITLSKTRFNGLRVTDVHFATIRHDMRSLCLASFHDDGGMEELGLWLAEAGFRDKPLSFFEFDTDGGELHCGVSLSKLLGVATPASMEALVQGIVLTRAALRNSCKGTDHRRTRLQLTSSGRKDSATKEATTGRWLALTPARS